MAASPERMGRPHDDAHCSSKNVACLLASSCFPLTYYRFLESKKLSSYQSDLKSRRLRFARSQRNRFYHCCCALPP